MQSNPATPKEIQSRSYVLVFKESLTISSKGLVLTITSVTITKVGGEEESMQTKVNRVPVESLDGDRRYSIKAIGIPSISEEATAVQMSCSVEGREKLSYGLE